MVEESDRDRGLGSSGGRARVSARRLYDLALDYAERSLASQADLVRSFEAEARALARDVGELVVDEDDDERLILTSEGRFSGNVLDDATSEWRSVASPEDVADHYDPVDLFTDLADAIAEAFPGVAESGEQTAGSANEASESSATGWADRPSPRNAEPTARSEQTAGQDGSPTSPSARPSDEGRQPAHESEQLRVLEDLRDAGVLSPAQFEHAKANLRR